MTYFIIALPETPDCITENWTSWPQATCGGGAHPPQPRHLAIPEPANIAFLLALQE